MCSDFFTSTTQEYKKCNFILPSLKFISLSSLHFPWCWKLANLRECVLLQVRLRVSGICTQENYFFLHYPYFPFSSPSWEIWAPRNSHIIPVLVAGHLGFPTLSAASNWAWLVLPVNTGSSVNVHLWLDSYMSLGM